MAQPTLRIRLQDPESGISATAAVQQANEHLSGGSQGIQHNVQQTWSNFSMMTEGQRATLLKGLLERCSAKEIDFVCSHLNIQLARTNQVNIRITVEGLLTVHAGFALCPQRHPKYQAIHYQLNVGEEEPQASKDLQLEISDR